MLRRILDAPGGWGGGGGGGGGGKSGWDVMAVFTTMYNVDRGRSEENKKSLVCSLTSG